MMRPLPVRSTWRKYSSACALNRDFEILVSIQSFLGCSGEPIPTACRGLIVSPSAVSRRAGVRHALDFHSMSGRRREHPLPARLPDHLPGRRRKAELVLLLLAGLAVIGFYASARLAGPEPWSYDESYHLGVARELASHFPLRSFPWTPFSILSEHFADKEPLFHLLLLPFTRLPLATAGLAGVLAGQLFLVAAFSWVVWRLRVPHAYAFVLALTLLGSMFAMRVDMCRPHLLLMAFSVLVVGLLVTWPETRPGAPSPDLPAPGARRPGRGAFAAVAGVAALFSLAHSGAWIALFYAAVWGLAGCFTAKSTSAPTSGAAARRPFLWLPLDAAAGG